MHKITNVGEKKILMRINCQKNNSLKNIYLTFISSVRIVFLTQEIRLALRIFISNVFLIQEKHSSIKNIYLKSFLSKEKFLN